MKIRWGLWLAAFAFVVNASQWQGIAAPDFSLPDQHGKVRQLSDFNGRWLVLYFYPKDDTPGCTTEARNFARDHAQFAQLNADIVGISLDDVASHKSFADDANLNFALLADVDKKAAKAYNVLGLGGFYTKRQTFLIDPKGQIAKHYESVDPDTHSAQLLRDLATLAGSATTR
jgi:peroxiredoxin Q/BCP